MAIQLNKPFDILVVATMSAGKSSLINALIGRELLHTANEATTACVTSVEHKVNEKNILGLCYSHSGHELERETHISSEQVRVWNANPLVKHIRLMGKYKISPRPASGLILHDTPGANNSQEARHAKVMLEAVRTIPFKMLLYVLNASQLEIQDDRSLLEQLRKELVHRPCHQVVFILNKIDLLDPERGEDIATCIQNAQVYLETIGFIRPIIVPTMADAALCARKALNAEPLTRVQHWKLRHALEGLSHNRRAPLHAANVPDDIRHNVLRNWKQLEMIKRVWVWANYTQACNTNELRQLVAYSGIATIEALINNQRRKLTHS